MSDPWLTFIGIGEDGLAGISQSSRTALAEAETVFGGSRHLTLAGISERGQAWPVPFEVAPVIACRGRKTVVLASGDPFWHGAGGTLMPHLAAGEWVAHPAPSTFSLAASRLGWRIEETHTLGLHAAPFERLVPLLHKGAKIICLVRDGAASLALCGWLCEHGWGTSRVWLLSALGGNKESVTEVAPAAAVAAAPPAPVAVAIEARGAGGLPRCAGLADDHFKHDGQITKRPLRALALSALAPRPGERLWDIGAGSGSISVEWALAGGTAIAFEMRADRAANVRKNAEAFGTSHRIEVIEGEAPAVLGDREPPDAVFIGGGLNAGLFDRVRGLLPKGVRLVAHAVTLESEALLSVLQERHGGELMKIEIAEAEPLGRMRSWFPSRPIVQWSVVL